MPFVTVPQAVAHLRIDSAADEPNLSLYIAAACDSVAQYLDRSVFESDASLIAAKAQAAEDGVVFDEYAMVANDTLRAAALLLLGVLSENREDVIVGTIATQLPFGSRALLAPYRARLGI